MVTNRPWIVVAALVAMLVTACNEPEPVVVVVTATPLLTDTPPPTNTPMPLQPTDAHQHAHARGQACLSCRICGLRYWSNGTADVKVTATLRNDGTLRLDGTQEITATCIADGDPRRDCREDLSLSLPDGHAPYTGDVPARLRIVQFSVSG